MNGSPARLELLKAEKELTRRSDELARKRQQLPWVCIDKEYVFDSDDGEQTLSDLFEGRSQLIVYHFMLGPTWTAGCPFCCSMQRVSIARSTTSISAT
jgi:predicted dithiol-disulfide oxidoreductase (DUF899 family)